MKKICILALIIILTSCLTVEATIELSDEGGGELLYRASVSTLAADLEQIDQAKNLIPFPLLEEAVNSAAERAAGVSLAEWEVSSDGTRYFVDSRVSFVDLASLSDFTGLNLSIEPSGSNRILRISVYDYKEEKPVSKSVIDIVNESFADDYIQIRITIPGSIIRVEGATFTGATVTYRKTISELLSSPSGVQFTVEYR
ncbi:MAG: hypothetical protein JXR86_16770 [Spirochaetales bacterium]|nr:hypothetical protein [Spirochaetales bacterium]